MNLARIVGVLSVAFATVLSSSGRAQSKASPSPYPKMAPIAQYRTANRDDEIALARSAAPSSISSSAGILVLGSRGYESAIKGTNGFVCFVERSWAAGFNDPEFWNPKLRSPNCFNPPAVRTELPRLLKRTEWVLAGESKQQLEEKTKAAVANGDFKAPDPGSLSYMMSKNGYVSDAAAGPWLPHVMFFVRHGEGDVWGANMDGSPIIANDGDASESTVVVIPVRRWSDGSPAPLPAELHKM